MVPVVERIGRRSTNVISLLIAGSLILLAEITAHIFGKTEGALGSMFYVLVCWFVPEKCHRLMFGLFIFGRHCLLFFTKVVLYYEQLCVSETKTSQIALFIFSSLNLLFQVTSSANLFVMKCQAITILVAIQTSYLFFLVTIFALLLYRTKITNPYYLKNSHLYLIFSAVGIAQVAIYLIAKFVISGSFNLLFLYSAELFPTSIR